MRIGVLALQGAFEEHIDLLRKLGADCIELRNKEDVTRGRMDGLVLPGGESTVMNKLLHGLGLYEPIRERIENRLPVFGTCAGLLLLAKKVTGGKPCFACMELEAHRNAYGRQLGSFETTAMMSEIGAFPMVFIRAPYIGRTGPGVEVLAEVNKKIVAARQDNMLVTAFHPELTGDVRVHQYFMKMISMQGKPLHK